MISEKRASSAPSIPSANPLGFSFKSKAALPPPETVRKEDSMENASKGEGPLEEEFHEVEVEPELVRGEDPKEEELREKLLLSKLFKKQAGPPPEGLEGELEKALPPRNREPPKIEDSGEKGRQNIG